MAPKARATGGETLDSPLRIEYYASDDESPKRTSFRKALRNPTKLFRDLKSPKKDTTTSSLSYTTAETTRSLSAMALNDDTPRDWPAGTLISESDDGVLGTGARDRSTSSQKRKPSRDHVEGTARSTSKSRTEVDIPGDATQSTTSLANKPKSTPSGNPLQLWFEANQENPYPTAEEKEWLATQSGRTTQQISTWFHHKRSRMKSLERVEDAQTAVMQWMNGLNADGTSQTNANAAESLEPSELVGTSKRWSQSDVVFDLLEQNKNDIAKAAGNYFTTQPGSVRINYDRASSIRDSIPSVRDSLPSKRDSAMTMATTAPSIFSKRSSTWTNRTSLTTPTDIMAGDGPAKRISRDSRDSSVFSRPPTSARSSIIGHPAIPFRTRSLRFDSTYDMSFESPPSSITPRSILQANRRREILNGELGSDRPSSQPPPEVDPDDVFSFEHPRKLPDRPNMQQKATASTLSSRSSRNTLFEESVDEEPADYMDEDEHASELELLTKIHPPYLSSPPTKFIVPAEQTVGLSLSPIDEFHASQTTDQPVISAAKLHSRRSKDIIGRTSFPALSDLATNIAPIAPLRTSSLRARSKDSSNRSGPSKKSSTPSLSRTKQVKAPVEATRQDRYLASLKDSREGLFAGVSGRKSMPIPSSFEKPATIPISIVDSLATRNIEPSESETSVSIDESDFDDASSGITDYSEETVKMEQRTEELGPVLQLVLANIRRDVVSRVIQELRGATEHGPQGRKASATTSNSQRGGSSEAATPFSQPSGAGNKRTTRDRDSDTPEDRDDEDQDKRRKLSNAPQPPSSLLRSRFACPFYKHNSENHQRWRSCKGPGWDEVRRVKEHVYRRHVLPIRCMRCYQTFKDEATLGRHAQEDVPCQRSTQLPEQVIEGCDKDQEKRLKCRKRKPGETEEDRWAEMYRVLFGDNCVIPTPYYDLDIQATTTNPNNLPIIEDQLRQLPQRLAHDISRMLSRPLDEQQRQDLPDIIRQSLQEVMQPFWQMLFPPSPTASQPRSAPPASDPGDSAYGSIDQDTRPAFTPPCFSGQDQESRTTLGTLGTVPEGHPVEENDSNYGYPLPIIMLDDSPIRSSHAQTNASSQAWSNVTPFTTGHEYYTMAAHGDPFSSHPTQNNNIYTSAPSNAMNPPTTGPPNDAFADLLYPEQGFLPDPPRTHSASNVRWSTTIEDREASQNLTPIWMEQFPNPFQVEQSTMSMHYSQPMPTAPVLNMPLLPHLHTSQPDMSQTFPQHQFSNWTDGKYAAAEG